jgi:hypothetical protein
MNSNYLFHQRMNGNPGLKSRNNDENLHKSSTALTGFKIEEIAGQREFGKDITNTVNEGTLPLFARKSMENKENIHRNPFVDTKVSFS